MGGVIPPTGEHQKLQSPYILIPSGIYKALFKDSVGRLMMRLTDAGWSRGPASVEVGNPPMPVSRTGNRFKWNNACFAMQCTLH